MSKDVNCPYCGHAEDINHDDGYGYHEDEVYQQQCGKCEKYYTYTTRISFDYYPEKADCLNGFDHDYKPTITSPKFMTRMRCSMCSNERHPTEDERILHSIPTYEDFLKDMSL